MVKRGDIVLIKYPFTDLSGSKVRPAVIVSPDDFINKNDDILCLFISSSIPDHALSTDYILENTSPFFSQTGLKVTSVFKCHKLALLNKSLVIRSLGNLHQNIMNEINNKLKLALGL